MQNIFDRTNSFIKKILFTVREFHLPHELHSWVIHVSRWQYGYSLLPHSNVEKRVDNPHFECVV